MRYTVFLKQDNNHYTAVRPLLPACSVEGRTREEVLENARVAIERTMTGMEVATVEVDVPKTSNPWLDTAGMFKDDLLFDEMLAEVASDRRSSDEQTQ
jgi:predicted RNase H-like HicB family nuclease